MPMSRKFPSSASRSKASKSKCVPQAGAWERESGTAVWKAPLLDHEPTTSLVLNRATIGTRARRRDGLAGERFLESDLHVVRRVGNIGRVRRGFAVDGAFVNDLALGIDD